MTPHAVPRWLMFAMLPVFAAAGFCVDYELELRLADNALASHFVEPWVLLVNLGHLFGPLLAALVIGYPFARLYERHWGLASVGVVLLVAQFYLRTYFDASDPLGTMAMMVSPGSFALFVPAVAAGVNRSFHGSRLVIAQADDNEARLRRPAALQWLLLPVLAIGFFIIHDILEPIIVDVGLMFPTHEAKRIGLLCAQVAGPALLAFAFSFPIARVYGRRAVLAGVGTASLTVWWTTRAFLDGGSFTFVAVSYCVQAVCLALSFPLAAWWTESRFRETRLAVAGSAMPLPAALFRR